KAAHNAILARCSMCHRNEPVWPGVHAPPKGVILDDADNIRRHAHLIEINAVRSNAMPPGNVTAMTAQGRQILAAWLAAGAPSQGHEHLFCIAAIVGPAGLGGAFPFSRLERH